jgi:hypothetical protein
VSGPIARVVVLPGTAVTRHVSAEGAEEVASRDENRADDLAAALGQALDVPAVVGEGDGDGDGVGPRPGPTDVVVVWPDALDGLLARSPGLASRCVVVGVPRTYTVRLPEARGLAAAVEDTVYDDWLGRGYGRPAAIGGRLDVAEAMGSQPSLVAHERTAHYARLTADAGEDLVAFLARYLRAYAALGA